MSTSTENALDSRAAAKRVTLHPPNIRTGAIVVSAELMAEEMTCPPAIGTRARLVISRLIHLRKLEPIYPGAASLRNAVDGLSFKEDEEGLPHRMPGS